MKLVVTIPAQNEAPTIRRVVEGVPRRVEGVDEIQVIVVDDGSTDATAAEASAAGATVVTLHGRPGLGFVFRTAIERAMQSGADLIVNIDGDGQFDSADIAHLVAPLVEERADFVTCSRFADPALHPVMPPVKAWGNRMVTRMINGICGGQQFTDVSCGFRAFSREAACRLTLFGRYTYTQECFIDLFSKGMRIVEVPLKVRGEREFGESRVARSVWTYARNSAPIILRAMRDIQPLKFFGIIGGALFAPGLLAALAVAGWYIYTGSVERHPRTSPITSLITISGVLITLSFVMGVLALLADMMGRHRRISEELLYLARRRMYPTRRTHRTLYGPDGLPPGLHDGPHVGHPLPHANGAANGTNGSSNGSNGNGHYPVQKSIKVPPAKAREPEPVGS